MTKRRPRTADLQRKLPNQDRAKRTVRSILAAAEKILSEENFEALTIRKIAKTAGVSLGSLYDYFPNKQAVLYRLLEERLGLLLRISDEAAAEDDPPKSYDAAFDRYVQLTRDIKYPSRVDLELRNAIDRDPQLASMTQHYEASLTDRHVAGWRRYGSDWSDANLRKLAAYAHQLDHINLKLQALELHDDRRSYGEMTSYLFRCLARYCGATKGQISDEKNLQENGDA
jgi:AcrR family transcriptional regulator